MKRLGLLTVPFMTLSFLTSCNSGYTITWVNYNGDVLEVDRGVKKGQTPHYDKATPTKPDEGIHTFSFTGWDPEITPVTESKTYKAVFGPNFTTIDVSFPEGTTDCTFEFDYTLKEGCTFNVDWGDGETNNETDSHTYDQPGKYKITIDNIIDLHLYRGGQLPGTDYITNICLGNYITSIGDSAFRECDSLTSITIPNSVTSIELLAFFNCSALKSIVIPNSVTSIGAEAFEKCYSLTSVTIPNSVTSIAGDAFENCSALTYNTFDNALYLGNKINKYVLLMGVKDKDLTSCEISGNCKFITNGAFESCYNLTHINIPKSVISIGVSAFESCFDLTEVDLKQFGLKDEIPTCSNNAFSGCSSVVYEVASKEMAAKFKDSGKGWPTTLNEYHWPGKSSNAN